jgi:parallel beta-helix repeat protein
MSRRRIASLRRPPTAKLHLEQFENRIVPSTYFVKTTADNGDNGSPTLGSLREGITFVNMFGFTEILFSLSPGAVIAPPAELPPLTKSATIDGKGVVELNGMAAGPAVGLNPAGGGAIRGLAINGFANGGVLLKGAPVTVEANFIGTNLGGTAAIPNKAGGVIIESAGHLVSDNVISGNGKDGVYLKGTAATANIIAGNKIGVALDGKSPLPNAGAGVFLDAAPGNVIGGTTGAKTNVISGNGGSGVRIMGPPASGNTVQGNRIGVAAGGAVAVPNGGDGVFVEEAPANLIGGPTPGAENIISGNKGNGVVLMTGSLPTSMPGTVVDHNFIGIDEAGTGDLGNALSGVLLKGSNNNTISANLISGNDAGGVTIMSGGNNKLVANRLGTNEFATAAVPNAGHGIAIGSGDNTVGGYAAADRNIVAGNAGPGLLLISPAATSNLVVGNSFGLDGTGLLALPNAGAGILIKDGASGNTIGGGDADDGAADGVVKARNVISGNGLSGVAIEAKTSVGNDVLGNFIGLDVSGKAAAPNGAYGVLIEGGVNNLVGGAAPGEGNVISGNMLTGVAIRGDDATGNGVFGNVIGLTDEPTPQKMGNKAYGVLVSDKASKNTIGLDVAGFGNTIAFNGESLEHKGHGVAVEAGTGNAIRANSIFENFGRGIDLNLDGPTLNDIGDSTVGANRGQDYPVVISRSAAGVLTWELDSLPNTSFHIDFFANEALDPSGFGEGKTYLGSKIVTTDAHGRVTVASDYAGAKLVSATATDFDGNTSEFSTVDTDADALADAWEIAGGLDLDEDGVITALEMILPGADPEKKDLYVEVDAMVGFAPSAGAFTKLTAAFAAAPAHLVHNPDGTAGITLHISLGDSNIKAAPFTAVDNYWTDFRAIKNGPGANPDGTAGHFGTQDQRINGLWPQIRQALTLTHRYCLFAQQYSYTDAQGNVESTSSGVGELFGNDFMVTVRPWFWGGANDDDRAGTLMHELGHTLGLRHGGGDEVNNKPNYHSVMNYSWQVRNGLRRVRYPAMPDYGASWRLDYSREAFGLLDESALNEAAGITVTDPYYAGLSFPYSSGDGVAAITAAFVESYGVGVDWNRNDNATDNPVNPARDINFDGATNSAISGFEDWSKLRFYFAEFGNFAAGDPTDAHVNESPTVASPTPPVVQSVVINGGAAQRSRVTTVTVTFSQPVTLPAAAEYAFELRRQSDAKRPLLAAAVDDTGPTTVVTLTFAGTEAVESGSLADGRYTLTVFAGQVSGGYLDGNADGTPGDDYVLASAGAPSPPPNIFRLFGDADGDGDVDATDFGAFRLTFGTGANLAFDFDGDGDVDAADFGQFRLRFGTSV